MEASGRAEPQGVRCQSSWGEEETVTGGKEGEGGGWKKECPATVQVTHLSLEKICQKVGKTEAGKDSSKETPTPV